MPIAPRTAGAGLPRRSPVADDGMTFVLVDPGRVESVFAALGQLAALRCPRNSLVFFVRPVDREYRVISKGLLR